MGELISELRTIIAILRLPYAAVDYLDERQKESLKKTEKRIERLIADAQSVKDNPELYKEYMNRAADEAKRNLPIFEEKLRLIEGPYKRARELAKKSMPGTVYTEEGYPGDWYKVAYDMWRLGSEEAVKKADIETLEQLSEEYEVARQRYDLANKAITDYENLLKPGSQKPEIVLPSGIEANKNNVKKPLRKPSLPSPSLVDRIRDFIISKEAGINTQSRANAETQRFIEGKKAMINYYTREGAPAEEQAVAMKEKISLTDLLRQKQEGLHKEANAVRTAILELEKKQHSINRRTKEGQIAYAEITQEIDGFKNRLSQLGVEWWDLQGQITSFNPVLEQTTKAFENAQKALDHWGKMGVLNTEQQIKKLRELATFKKMTTEEQWQIDEQLHDKYMALMNEQYRELEKSYRDQLEKIEQDAETQIKGIQEQLDSLDKDEAQGKRKEAESEHNKRLEEFQKQRRYHELRTGQEHAEAIAEIDKQIAEETHQWEQQQAEWTREDKREELNKQITDIRENAEKQKKEWAEAWAKIEELFSEHNKNIISSAAAASKEWYDTWKVQIDKLKTDIVSGAPSNISNTVSSAGQVVTDAGETLPGAGGQPLPDTRRHYLISPGEYRWLDDKKTTIMKSRILGEYLGETVDWNQNTKEVIFGGQPYKPAVYDDKQGVSWLPIRRVAEDFGWTVGWNAADQTVTLDKAHRGAKTLSYGLAELTPGELIFPPGLSVKLERLIAVLETKPLQQISTLTVDRGHQVQLNGPLFNAERVQLENKLDMEIFARELGRAVRRLQYA